MKNRKTIIITVLLIAILALGIGYAAINSTTLTISGNAIGSPDDDNFVVKFTGTPTKSSTSTVKEASILTDTTASIKVADLTKKGDKASATYTITNDSADLSASLSASLTNSDTTNFSVSYYFGDTTTTTTTSVAAKGTTTITVVVELLTTPVTADVTSNITATITAAPTQPTV